MNRTGTSTILSGVLGVVVAAFAMLTWTAGDAGDAASEVPARLAMAASEPSADVEAPAADVPSPAPDPAEAASAAPAEPDPKIIVHIRRRVLHLVERGDTVLRAPVAIGMNDGFEYDGRKWHFETPRGRRRIIGKAPDPVWTVPEWHYYEKATKKGLEAVKLEYGDTIPLEDGSFLVASDSVIGRINQFGNFAAFTPGVELIFDGRIYIPPITSEYRRVRDALGPYKLDMGDGYLIHGTHYYNEESIGEAVSHGCIRMNNDDLVKLYERVPRGTVVEIL